MVVDPTGMVVLVNLQDVYMVILSMAIYDTHGVSVWISG